MELAKREFEAVLGVDADNKSAQMYLRIANASRDRSDAAG